MGSQRTLKGTLAFALDILPVLPHIFLVAYLAKSNHPCDYWVVILGFIEIFADQAYELVFTIISRYAHD